MNKKKEQSLEDIINKIEFISMRKSSPIEKWFNNLNSKNIAELYIFNFNYCWLYILDNKLVKLDMHDIVYYILVAHKNILKIVPEMDEGKFMEIYTDRMKMLKIELKKYRESMNSATVYFPSYYFGRILEYPLMNNIFKLDSNYCFGGWNINEITGMFSHQFNFIQDNLDALLK